MRGRGILVLAVVAAALLAWWLLAGRPDVGRDDANATPDGTGEEPERVHDPAGPEVVLKGKPGPETVRPEDVPPAIPEEDRIRLRGRVLDDRRRPVAGVDVLVYQVGQPDRRATTDDEGHFESAVVRPARGRWERVVVVARRGAREVGIQPLFAGYETRGTLEAVVVLLPGSSLAVLVESAGGTPLEAEVVLTPWHLQGGYVVAHARTATDGRAVVPAVADGHYRVLAHAPGHGRGLVLTGLPRHEDGPLVVRLPPARDVDLTVVAEDTKEPVSDAAIELWERIDGRGWVTEWQYLPMRAVAPTDAAGHTQIPGLAPGDSPFLIVAAEGFPPLLPQGLRRSPHPTIPPEVTEHRIELRRPRTIVWPITDAESPVPEDGTVVTLDHTPGAVRTSLPKTATMVEGKLRAEGIGPGWVHALATTPDGRMAQLFAKADATEGNETSFRLARTIRVHVTFPDGEPATGLCAQARDQGNNALHEAVPLDEGGRCEIPNLHGRRVEVYVCDAGYPYGGQSIGTVDLQVGDGEVEGTIARRRQAVLSVRIDGEPRLPARYSFTTGVEVTGEDPERGEIRFRWRPGSSGNPRKLYFRTGGYIVERDVDTLSGTGPEPDRLSVELASGATLVAHVTRPADGRAALAVERWDAEEKGWVLGQRYFGPGEGLDPDGRQTFGPLRAGRYRVASTSTGLASEAVDLRPGEPPVEVALDLSKVGYAKGRVEVPVGYDVTQVRIRTLGMPESPARQASDARVWGKGTFRVRIPGTMSIRLRPVHPTLVPAPEGGEAEVLEPCEGVVLKLVEGDLATLQLDPPPVFPRHDREHKVAVRLYEGPVAGEPSTKARVVCEEGRVRFGDFAPGTYTLWIDAPGFAPAVVEGVELKKGRNDLGRVELSAGTKITIHVLVPEGQAVPRLGISTRHEDEPIYLRYMSTHGEAEATLPGLGPGRFRLRVYGHMGLPAQAKGGLDEVIEVDGTEAIERTLDLR